VDRVRATAQVIAVDTSLVVRYLVEDDVTQADRAEAVLRGGAIWVPKTVILDLDWVLRSVYRLDRTAGANGIAKLLGLPGVEVEDQPAVARALDWYGQGLDFADALHLASSARAEAFATFDLALQRRARRIPSAMPIMTP
jgi:predicted nucleic-acid-binding protein